MASPKAPQESYGDVGAATFDAVALVRDLERRMAPREKAESFVHDGVGVERGGRLCGRGCPSGGGGLQGMARARAFRAVEGLDPCVGPAKESRVVFRSLRWADGRGRRLFPRGRPLLLLEGIAELPESLEPAPAGQPLLLALVAHRSPRPSRRCERRAVATLWMPVSRPSSNCQSGSLSSGKSCGLRTSSEVSPARRRRASSRTFWVCSSSSWRTTRSTSSQVVIASFACGSTPRALLGRARA